VQGTFFLLPVKIGTTDTSKLHSIKALLDCRATRSFIDRDFVCSKGMNTQTLSRNILVFNIDSSPNEAGQISEVVDVVLWYKTHVRGPLTHDSRVPPLPPNTNSLCSPWLPKNGMQGHFSIYCRLFPLGASSNSLRNLLEISCNIFHSIIYLRNLLECSALVALTVRLLCSLLSLVICTVVNQVAVLPSYNSKAIVSLQIVCQVALLLFSNSKATASSLCSLPVPVLFQFILIYLNLYEVYRILSRFLSEF